MNAPDQGEHQMNDRPINDPLAENALAVKRLFEQHRFPDARSEASDGVSVLPPTVEECEVDQGGNVTRLVLLPPARSAEVMPHERGNQDGREWSARSACPLRSSTSATEARSEAREGHRAPGQAIRSTGEACRRERSGST